LGHRVYSAEIKKRIKGALRPGARGALQETNQEDSPFDMVDKNSRHFQHGGISRCLLIPGASTSVEAHDDDNDNCEDQKNDYCDDQTDYESHHIALCCLVADTGVLERTGVARVHLHISRTHHNFYLRIMAV